MIPYEQPTIEMHHLHHMLLHRWWWDEVQHGASYPCILLPLSLESKPVRGGVTMFFFVNNILVLVLL